MKTIDRSSVAEVSGDFESEDVVIDANGKAFKELINGIYSDKAYAIARETIANGIDSHIAAGTPDKPLEIHVPTLLEPYYSIRDFGVSMTHETVMTLYRTLFRSSKDNPDSDESNNYTGKFGLGSKTPWAYTDSFQLTCYLDGKQRIYDCYFNGAKPKVALFQEGDTDEANGVLVTFGVAAKDFHDFERAIRRAVEGIDVVPIFLGKQPTLHVREVKAEGNGWKLLDATQSGRAEARQGTVLYPLNFEAVINCPHELQALFNQPFRFDFAIGQLDIVTSREALSYDEETSANIVARLQEVVEDIRTRITEEVKAATTYWDFCARYYDAMEKFPQQVYGNYAQGWTFQGRAPQREVEVRTSGVRTTSHDAEGKAVHTFQARFGGMTYAKWSGYDMLHKTVSFRADRDGYRDRISLDTTKELIVVVEDIREKNRYPMQRITRLIGDLRAEDSKRVSRSQLLWIRHAGDSEYVMNRLFVAFGRPPLRLFNLLDVEYEAPPRQTFRGQRVPFRIWSENSATWKKPQDDMEIPETAWWVPMRNGDTDPNCGFSAYQIATAKDLFAAAGDENVKIIGIPVSSRRKVLADNPGWIDAAAYVTDNIEMLFDADDFINFMVTRGYRETPGVVSLLTAIKEKIGNDIVDPIINGCVLGDLMQEYERFQKKDSAASRVHNLMLLVQSNKNNEIVSRNSAAKRAYLAVLEGGCGASDWPEPAYEPLLDFADKPWKAGEEAAVNHVRRLTALDAEALRLFPLLEALHPYSLKHMTAFEIVKYIENKRVLDDFPAPEDVDIQEAA